MSPGNDEQPVDIVGTQKNEVDPYTTADSSASLRFGSPEQVHRYASTPQSASDVFGPSTSSRPGLGNRSISSPLVTPRRKTAPQQRISTGHKIHTPRTQREWTVFGQIMENAGRTLSVRRRPSNVHIRLNQYESPGSGPVFTSARKSDGDPFLDIGTSEEHESRRLSRSPSPSSPIQRRSHDAIPDEYSSSDSDSDADADADSDSTPGTCIASSTASSPPTNTSWYPLGLIRSTPILYRNVLKCSIAYFVASLFTFNPYLAGFLSRMTFHGSGNQEPFPTGHMVATIAVYYNPAKTIGGMIEADIFCLVGLVYSAFVCISSMKMFWWLELSPGWEWLGDVVAILWIGVSMSIVAWFKIWMANPSFNTACSMTSIIIFVVIVKEGGIRTLLQVSAIVVLGSIISNAVCYLIWPQSAILNLQNDMTNTLKSFSAVLNMLTDTFLLEGGVHKKKHLQEMQRAVESHQRSFTSLKKSFTEARTEWPLRGDSADVTPENRGRQAYEDAVDSLNRLGQHLNGLRSGTRLQHDLTKAGMVRGRRKHGKNINNLSEHDLDTSMDDEEETAMLKTAAVMFGDLVDDLGPPLKALSTACTSSLNCLQAAFKESQSPQRRKGVLREDFSELVNNIERALVRFESTSNHAVLRLYRKSDMINSSRPPSVASYHERDSIYSTRGEDADNTLLLGAENERVFLVYFFIFTLQEYAREVVSLVDAIRRVHHYEKDRVEREHWWKRLYHSAQRHLAGLSLQWSAVRSSDPPRRPTQGLRRTLSSYVIPDIRRPVPSFPKVRPHAPNTIQTPSRNKLTRIGRIKQTLWTIGKRMAERDVKYAFKVGMAISIFAAPAFYDTTRPIFVKYWGDWALISFFVVISPTIGATNHLGFQRILGTLFGATVATAIFSLYPDSPVVLAIFGFLFSLPCFYYAVAYPQYLSASRFVLLTYNLSCLYCYNLRQEDLSVVEVAAYRALAVTAGVIWAAIISRFWWPAEARRELGRALGEFCLNIGWLYSRLVASNSFAPEYYTEGDNNGAVGGSSHHPAPSQSTKLNNSVKEFMAMELHLQIKLIELQGLLAQTQHEPRLKGPFPILLYRGVLTSLQTILDKLHSMRCATTREEWYTSVRQDFIIPVNKERREMVGNIILSLSTLASAFRLKAPLPPYLPPVEKARQDLVNAIRKLDVVKNRDAKGSRQLLFFAYAVAMKGVTEELEVMGRTMQTAFGVIGDTPEEFEALFMYPEDSQRRIDEAA